MLECADLLPANEPSCPAAQARDRAEPPSQVEVRVWLFGLIARTAGERDVSLKLPAGATVGDVLVALGRRYGEAFLAKEKASTCRVSLNGHLEHVPAE